MLKLMDKKNITNLSSKILFIWTYEIHRGLYMSAHVLLNLLYKLVKRDTL